MSCWVQACPGSNNSSQTKFQRFLGEFPELIQHDKWKRFSPQSISMTTMNGGMYELYEMTFQFSG